MLGILNDVSFHTGAGFVAEGDTVWLLGGEGQALCGDATTLAGSEFLRTVHGVVAGRPSIDLAREVAVQRACLAGIRSGVIRSAHDCADGGLAIALAECCILGNRGLDARGVTISGRIDAALFGEEQSRIVVTCRPAETDALAALAANYQVQLTRIGSVMGDRLRLGNQIDLAVAAITETYDGGLVAALGAPVRG